jgi:hypothetical protein
MALTLLQICNRVLDEISSFNAPTYIVGNDDDTAKTLLAMAQKVGEELVRDYDWQELFETATVTTVAATTLYDLEDDYDRIASDTMWEEGTYRMMRGHKTRREWAAITNVQVDAGITYKWRLKGSQIQVHPAPASVFDFNYEYLSNHFCASSAGTTQAQWTADTDLPRLPYDLFIAGIRYYFANAKNLPYASAEAEYEAILMSRQGRNVPAEAINMEDAICEPGSRVRNGHFVPDRVDA